MKMLKEIRFHPRVPTSGQATLSIDGRELSIELNNLSEGGLQADCSIQVFQTLAKKKLPDGTWPLTQVRFKEVLACPRLEGLCAECRLVYQRRLNSQMYHVGLAFLEVPATGRELIAEAVRSRL